MRPIIPPLEMKLFVVVEIPLGASASADVKAGSGPNETLETVSLLVGKDELEMVVDEVDVEVGDGVGGKALSECGNEVIEAYVGEAPVEIDGIVLLP